MAWSSFAHLPTTEKEYLYILSHLKNGMSIHDVDNIIAMYKNKEKVPHHYRSNLVRIGFFETTKGYIYLNYDPDMLNKNEKFLFTILRKVIEQNQAIEIKEVRKAIETAQSYVVKDIADILKINHNQLIDCGSLIRWIRPIVVLYQIVDILFYSNEESKNYANYLQKAYLKITKEYGDSVSLELIELELKKADASFHVVSILDNILENINMRFKIELLMLPNWATKNQSYKIGQDIYTHIRIKVDLLQEV